LDLCLISTPSRVTMSQKSSLAQQTKSVSQALTPNTPGPSSPQADSRRSGRFGLETSDHAKSNAVFRLTVLSAKLERIRATPGRRARRVRWIRS
jgi:hypothetical protein